MNKITNFKITKLHETKNYDIKIKDNTLILVGENGAGKTTILRLLYYFLTCQWVELVKYNFKKIEVTIDNKSYSVLRSELEHNSDFLNKYLRRMPPHIRMRFLDALENGDYEQIDKLSLHYRIPSHYLENEFEQLNLIDVNHLNSATKKLRELSSIFKETLKFNILYLPTFRRIEQELTKILKSKELDPDEWRERENKRLYNNGERKYLELIEFGMGDVEDSIEDVLEQLKSFQSRELNTLTLAYLGDVVDKKYKKVQIEPIEQVSEQIIEKILKRIDERLLSNKTKENLKNIIQKVKDTREFIDEHSMVSCHYFTKLLEFQNDLEQREMKIKKFCDVCNKYIINKKFIYLSSDFTCKIYLKNTNEEIKLYQLSSGEKQIVSLFSHLYLSEKDNYFVLIDEPELSLSVPWQREFLVDIKNGGFCSSLIAVTHSPFIYENELEKYAHGLGEFTK